MKAIAFFKRKLMVILANGFKFDVEEANIDHLDLNIKFR